jgi:hypothetical protein
MVKVRKRKKNKVVDVEEKKDRKPGSGRRPMLKTKMSAGIYIRCTEEQKVALVEFVRQLSDDRMSKGLSKVEVSTWLRELGLKYSGNEELGIAAQLQMVNGIV